VNAPVFFHDGGQKLFEATFTGYFAWCGMRIIEMGDGAATVALNPRTEMLTPWGTLNGGVVNVLVEHPTYLALLTLLKEAEFPMTSDVFIQHLRPLPGDAEYTLRSTVIRRGKTMAWVNTDVFANDVLVSTARITKTILPAKP
jgi:uncharacterized protein (TIGR00369 family)